jgi:hypothetical protein
MVECEHSHQNSGVSMESIPFGIFILTYICLTIPVAGFFSAIISQAIIRVTKKSSATTQESQADTIRLALFVLLIILSCTVLTVWNPNE